MEDSVDLGFKQGLESHNRRVYVNLGRIRKGGSAETYLVLCTSGPQSGHLFAAKIFRRLSKPERRLSFLQEHAFLRGCTHPSIMRVFDDGFFLDDRPFFIAEYLPQTLADEMKFDRSLIVRLSYTMQLLSGLKYLSSNGVVHRGVKPANILLKGGSCVLGDFGLMKHYESRAVESDRAHLKESLGPGMPRAYRTPDLVDYLNGKGPPSPKSDVFQLGLVLAELFTGSNPQIPMARGKFRSRVRLRPMAAIEERFGGAIRDLISAMLEIDSTARPTASDILENWKGLFLSAAAEQRDLEGSIRAVI